ncbi:MULTISPECIES: malto-oligosyltrehalose trehalohydrolase [Cellvibrio]|uniref:Malto-oligosyltrehalose trehalohydrolase n=1 Tax=Cellvibrio fibrivorans TaxID=126350 RepID=A0ABU1UW93_9GAMM|nr:malto-oligosyltrehalose trehalohydrolase [Cellvibrio fibrivorans]MDR7089456.1 maltooligosyltrehalose trehalohydrolase [Cellvibrio fibrivorans]
MPYSTTTKSAFTKYESVQETYSHGAFPLPDGTTRFSLWAPDADKVDVSLGDGRLYPLEYKKNGWYSTRVECVAGTAYRYIINGKARVPDPAARLQHGDAHGLSCVVDQAYPWQTNSWEGLPWHQTVLYELHVGLIGGFSKVERLLPSLARLGITAIELMPINEFPGTRNWGYDGVLPFAPEASYGTPDELKRLIDTAHSLGLMVFLDVVYNHFGPDGNYLGEYASGFFRHDIHTPWGAAIDFRKREVRDFFCENALMWIFDYRFDGLRLDAVHTISEKDFLVELADRVRSALPFNRHVHLILENEDNSASLLEEGFNAQWNDDGHNVLHYLLTGEDEGYYADFAKSPTVKLARCLGEGFIYQGEMSHTGRYRGEPSAHLSPTAFVLFLQNHDQVGNRALGERLPQIADPDALKAAVTLMLLSPMIPMLFMGEEWGEKHPFLYFTDHEDNLAKAVRDGRRAEFAHFTQFQDPSMRQQIPDPNAISTFLSSRIEFTGNSDTDEQEEGQLSERERWWSFYQQLLTLRRTHVTPFLPGARSTGTTIMGPRAIRAAWILGNGSQLGIYLNLSHSRVMASPPWDGEHPLFRHNVAESDYQQGILPPYSAVVIMRL